MSTVVDTRFLHLVIDDKFINAAIQQFNTLTQHNRYLFYTPKAHYTFKHIGSHAAVELYSCAPRKLERLLANTNVYDVLVLHSLSPHTAALFGAIHDRARVWWLSWGYDLYNEHLINAELLLERTTALYRNLAPCGNTSFFRNDDLRDIAALLFFQPRSIPFLFSKLAERIARRWETPERATEQQRELIEHAVGRINYCSTVIPDEFDLLKRKDFFAARQLPFGYGFDHDICSTETALTDPLPHDDGILIGNSASYENNHLDLFELLRSLPASNRPLIVPLNYGDRSYARAVAHVGHDLFGDRFCPLFEFMPFLRYTELLRSCRTALFYHERQQALGTIILMLWNGSKVFMSKSSLLYRHLKRLGLVLFTLQDDMNPETLNASLPREIVLAQRTILSREYSYAAIRAKIKESVETIAREPATRQ